jgi:23S rRNA (uracil1939-C5)-methyltransferase
LSIDAYRNWKRSLLATALARRGIEEDAIEVVDAHGSGRRRVTFHVRHRDGRAAVGFMAVRSHDLIAIDACPVLAPELAAAPQIAHKIAVHFVAAEQAFDIALTATATGIDCSLRSLRASDHWCTEDLAQLLAELAVVRLSINGRPVIETTRPVVAFGEVMVPLPPDAFLQATAAGEKELAALVLARTRRRRNIADLFCGIGPFALRLAEHARVTAIDCDAGAIAALDSAARHTRGLKPVTSVKRDLFREPLTGQELAPFDAVIFDPPRQGADAQARRLAQSPVETIIAVSCDAATFARDAATLIAGGYRLSDTVVIDQFLWSSHIEIAATFTRGLPAEPLALQNVRSHQPRVRR